MHPKLQTSRQILWHQSFILKVYFIFNYVCIYVFVGRYVHVRARDNASVWS